MKKVSFVKNIRGLIWDVRVIVLSFFFSCLIAETGSGYPGNCNRVPGS